MKKFWGVVLVGAVCLAGMALAPSRACAQAQSTTGVIEGLITDPSGAGIPSAEVKLNQKETGFERVQTTDSSGFYRAILLPLGHYTILVKASGFADLLRENLELTVGQTLTINIAMQLKGVSQTVTVSTETPVVETARTEQSSLIDSRSVTNLPINGRNFIDFIKLTANIGIVQGPDGNEININGQRGIYNNVMIDGADANNPFFGEQRGGQRPKYIVSLEAVKEFQVVAEGASAEFGRSAGGFVNMVTKSGSNELHGSGFYFFRGGGLIGQNFDGTSDIDVRQHQFGGSLGGPIVKDKGFFFFSYDQNTEHRFKNRSPLNSDPKIGGAPLSAADCAAITVPGVPCGGTVTAGTTLLAFLNRRFGDTVDSNASGVPPNLRQTNNARVLLAKGDWRFTPNNLFTARYTYSQAEQLDGTFDVQSWFTSANGLEQDTSHSIVLQLTSSITPTLLNEARFQYAREPRPRPYPYQKSVTGVTNPFGALPDTAVLNITSTGDNSFRWGQPFFLPIPFATDSRFQAQDNFAIVHGRHSIKFGFDYNRTNMTQAFIGFANGRYIFFSPRDFINYVQDGPSPNGLLFYLQRVPLGGRTIEQSGTQSIPVHEPALFIQDKWQIFPNLSFNYGLRWEAQFEPGPLTPPSGTPYAPFFSDPRFPTKTGVIPSEKKGFQPRAGLAWDPTRDGKTAIRISGGIFYARTPSLILAQPRISNGVINTNLFANGAGFNASALPVYGTLSTSLAVAPAFGDLYVFADNYHNPRSWQWSVSGEREIAKNLSVGVAFNYANSVHLTRFIDRNYPALACKLPDGRPVYSASICTGWRVGPDPGTPAPIPVLAGGGATPFPLGHLFTIESSAKSLYRAVTFTVNKKFTQHWQLQANYVLSWDYSDDDNERDPFVFQYADANNLKPEYRFSNRDERHRFNVFSVFDLPGHVLFSVILQGHSAQPTVGSDLCTFSEPGTPAGNCDIGPNRLGDDPNGDGQTTDRIFVNGKDVGRNRQRKNNELFTFDFRVSRPFRWADRYALEPIFEVFNVTNKHNIIQSAGTNLFVNFDGTIRSGLGDPRQAQVGLRFTF